MPSTPGRKLTLRRGPEGAPNFCFGLYAEDGTCVTFVQSDWDYPSLARACGWSVREVNKSRECEHESTDGTIDCRQCGTKTGEFLSAAFDWLSLNDGTTFQVHDYGDSG